MLLHTTIIFIYYFIFINIMVMTTEYARLFV